MQIFSTVDSKQLTVDSYLGLKRKVIVSEGNGFFLAAYRRSLDTHFLW